MSPGRNVLLFCFEMLLSGISPPPRNIKTSSKSLNTCAKWSHFLLHNSFKLLCLNWSLIFYLKYSFCWFVFLWTSQYSRVFLPEHIFALFRLLSLCFVVCLPMSVMLESSWHNSYPFIIQEKWELTDGGEDQVESNFIDTLFRKPLFLVTQSVGIQNFRRKQFSGECLSSVKTEV